MGCSCLKVAAVSPYGINEGRLGLRHVLHKVYSPECTLSHREPFSSRVAFVSQNPASYFKERQRNLTVLHLFNHVLTLHALKTSKRRAVDIDEMSLLSSCRFRAGD